MYLDEKALPRLPWPELREMGEESGDEAGGVSGWPTKCADATDEFARNVGDFAVPRKWEDSSHTISLPRVCKRALRLLNGSQF